MKSNAGVLLMNDLHLNKDNTILIDYIFQQAVDVCRERDIRHIIFGGDIFTNRPGQHLSSLRCLQNNIDILKKNDIISYAIPGNHDKVDPESEDSYLDVFNSDHFIVFKNFQKKVISGVDFILAPYFKEEKWGNLLRDFNGSINSRTILISHISINGVMNNDGTIVDSGVSTTFFNDFNKVLIGHYHNASILKKNIYYTGSCYQNNYGEKIKDKGFTIINKDLELEFVPTLFPKYEKQSFSIEEIGCKGFNDFISKWEGNTTDHVRIIFKGRRDDFMKIPFEELISLGFDVKFEALEQLESMKYGENHNEIIFQTKNSIKKDFIRFCNEEKIKGKRLKMGLNIIGNV